MIARNQRGETKMTSPNDLPAWAFQNPTNFVHAPRWLRDCVKAQHFAPTNYTARNTSNGVEVWAWNSKRAEHYDADDAQYATTYMR